MSGVQAVKSFRIHQLKGLSKFISRFGPLPSPAEPLNPAFTHRLPNPFIPRKNPITGRWAPPTISRRRQAELIKHAKASGTMYLLPPGPMAPRTTAFAPEEAAKAAKELCEGSNSRGEFEKVWMEPVDWEGKFEPKEVPGAELGTRLYSGKKKMFKGHKWERLKKQKDIKRRILLRDMDKRIQKWKSYYQRRRPNPLKAASFSKSRKLPF